MGLPCSRLVIATNSNDILDRFMTSGIYSKEPVHDTEANGGILEDGAKAHTSGVKETLSPAMDILVSSNFERLLACLAFSFYSSSPSPTAEEKQNIGHSYVRIWLQELRSTGRFTVDPAILSAAQEEFSSERVDDEETITTIRSAYSTFSPDIPDSEGTTGKTGGYILDPHSAIGIAASLRSMSMSASEDYTISLATAHPAKFANAVDLALDGAKGYNFNDVLPHEFKHLETMPRRVEPIGKAERLEKVKSLINERVPPKQD